MTVPDTFTDSTDWLNTSLAVLAPLDASLRCQVCKDYFTTPMITSCSHTFCSLCIRRYLSQEGRCPACRESDQEIKLRRNWSVEESVIQFKAGRDELLKVARKVEEQAHTDEGPRPKKRRKVGTGEALPERRSTRSQSRRHAAQSSQNGHSVQSSQEEVQDSDEGSVYEDKFAPQETSEPHDGLVACPCCTRRMKETLINAHLDKCIAGEATPSPRRSNTPQVQAQTTSIAYGQTKPVSPHERLPTLNYSMLNDNALRRKLKELGIPNHGSKELMRKRHVEWVNLWNANCDSLRPVPKRQLLQDLDRWEKTLGRQIDRGPSGVMVKDFDRDGWQKSNKGDFDDLIRRAREKRIAAAAAAAVAKAEDDDKGMDVETDISRQDEGLDVEPGKRSLEDVFDGVSRDDKNEHDRVAVNGVHGAVSTDVAMGGIPPDQRLGVDAEGPHVVASGALPNGSGTGNGNGNGGSG